MFFRYSIISAAKESLDVVKPSLELSIEQRYYFVIMTKLWFNCVCLQAEQELLEMIRRRSTILEATSPLVFI